MNKITEALKLAAKALSGDYAVHPDEALAAIREALAEPVKQEPVAWRWETHNGHAYSEEHYEGEGGEPLYTTPPSVEAAIEATKEKVLACYSPDDTANDWADKIKVLK